MLWQNDRLDKLITMTKFFNKSPLISLVHVSIGVLLIGLVIFLALGVGFGTWENPLRMDEIAWQIRYPRILTALLVGLCLSVGGSALQALFQNPLADPSLIGTSGGAALGVVFALSLGLGEMSFLGLDLAGIGVSLFAFLGAMSVCGLILLFYRLFGGGQVGLLILGFVMSAFCGALVSLVLFMSDDLTLRSATNWLSGSMAEAGFVPFSYVLVAIGFGLVILLPMGRKLDILMLGEKTAISMGQDVGKIRLLTVIGAALLTASAVALAGVIGFIGMMIPNLLAYAWGGSRTRLMIGSGVLGAVAMLIIDTVARFLTYPVDVPVGIVLALIGSPFFIWIFIKTNQRGNRG